MLRNLVLLVAVATTLSVTAVSVNYEDYTFEKFMDEFQVNYGPNEIESRREFFMTELNRVRAHNSKKLGWTESINKFSAMTVAEKKNFLGRNKRLAKGDKKLKFARELPHDFTLKPVDQLAKSVDWRGSGVDSPVKDQGHCGSCWAFASTAVIESHVALKTGLLFDLSVQQMAMCAPNVDSCGGTGGCAGSTAELAFEYVSSSKGLVQEFQYPYTSYYGQNSACSALNVAAKATIDGYVQLPANNYTALMNAVATVGPVAVSVDAAAWGAYSSGIFSGCNQVNPDIDHAVVLMGYGEENGQKYWLIRNSWSPSWGERGYIRLARRDAEEEVCGLDVTPQDGTACAGDDEAVKVCGTCGVLYDSAYPLGAALI